MTLCDFFSDRTKLCKITFHSKSLQYFINDFILHLQLDNFTIGFVIYIYAVKVKNSNSFLSSTSNYGIVMQLNTMECKKKKIHYEKRGKKNSFNRNKAKKSYSQITSILSPRQHLTIKVKATKIQNNREPEKKKKKRGIKTARLEREKILKRR